MAPLNCETKIGGLFLKRKPNTGSILGDKVNEIIKKGKCDSIDDKLNLLLKEVLF